LPAFPSPEEQYKHGPQGPVDSTTPKRAGRRILSKRAASPARGRDKKKGLHAQRTTVLSGGEDDGGKAEVVMGDPTEG